MALLDSNHSTAVKRVVGTKLQRRLTTMPRTFAALLAESMTAGEVVVGHFAQRQACKLTGARPRDLQVIRNATPFELAAMRKGDLDIDTVRKSQLANKPVSDKKLRTVIQHAGVERVFGVLDELTAPTTNGTVVSPNGHAATGGNGSAITTSAELL
jgi:hypothetical protein